MRMDMVNGEEVKKKEDKECSPKIVDRIGNEREHGDSGERDAIPEKKEREEGREWLRRSERKNEAIEENREEAENDGVAY